VVGGRFRCICASARIEARLGCLPRGPSRQLQGFYLFLVWRNGGAGGCGVDDNVGGTESAVRGMVIWGHGGEGEAGGYTARTLGGRYTAATM
jgi:hypothetical protein